MKGKEITLLQYYPGQNAARGLEEQPYCIPLQA